MKRQSQTQRIKQLEKQVAELYLVVAQIVKKLTNEKTEQKDADK